MDQFGNGIHMLQGLMEQPYNKHEASMQWGALNHKGQTLVYPKNSTKNARNDGQPTHVNKQTHGPKVKAQKGTPSRHQRGHACTHTNMILRLKYGPR